MLTFLINGDTDLKCLLIEFIFHLKFNLASAQTLTTWPYGNAIGNLLFIILSPHFNPTVTSLSFSFSLLINRSLRVLHLLMNRNGYYVEGKWPFSIIERFLLTGKQDGGS